MTTPLLGVGLEDGSGSGAEWEDARETGGSARPGDLALRRLSWYISCQCSTSASRFRTCIREAMALVCALPLSGCP